MTRWGARTDSRPFGRMHEALLAEKRGGAHELKDAWNQAYVKRRPGEIPDFLKQFVRDEQSLHEMRTKLSDAEQEQFIQDAIKASEDPETERALTKLYTESAAAIRASFDAVVPDSVKESPPPQRQWTPSQKTIDLRAKRVEVYRTYTAGRDNRA